MPAPMQATAITLKDCSLRALARAGGQELGSPANPENRIELEQLLSKNLPRFRRLAMRWLRNPEDAEDAVQDAVLSAFKHVARFERRAQMSTWLMAIVINAVRMQLRRRPRQQILSLDQPAKDDQFTIADLIADPGPTPEQTLEQCELRALVAKVAGSLSTAQRAAMQLRDWDDLSTSEAAEALGVPVGTLKAQLARGRAKLTRRLRQTLGMSRTRTSHRDFEARPDSRGRRETVQGAVSLPGFRFEDQGGAASWMGV